MQCAVFILYHVLQLLGHLYSEPARACYELEAIFDDGSLCDTLVAAWEKAIRIHEQVGN